MAFNDGILYTLRYYFLAGSVMNDLLVHLEIIMSRGVSLKKEMKFLAKPKIKAKVIFDLQVMPNREEKNFRYFLKASLILNFIS